MQAACILQPRTYMRIHRCIQPQCIRFDAFMRVTREKQRNILSGESRLLPSLLIASTRGIVDLCGLFPAAWYQVKPHLPCLDSLSPICFHLCRLHPTCTIEHSAQVDVIGPPTIPCRHRNSSSCDREQLGSLSLEHSTLPNFLR